ncbi:MAG: hypothetical protein HY000_02220 [Planctomycetes bacterium]|nr:hypothetical protein [Planctomycetota bacterium]
MACPLFASTSIHVEQAWKESACVGVMMNTRALMALIVINLGMDLGVITPSVFCMLVLMALLTTVMTTPALLWLMKGTELEPHISAIRDLSRSRGEKYRRKISGSLLTSPNASLNLHAVKHDIHSRD